MGGGSRHVVVVLGREASDRHISGQGGNRIDLRGSWRVGNSLGLGVLLRPNIPIGRRVYQSLCGPPHVKPTHGRIAKNLDWPSPDDTQCGWLRVSFPNAGQNDGTTHD